MTLNVVTVNVSASTIPTTREGFGVVAVPSPNANWAGSLVRGYGSAAEVAADPAFSGSARLFERRAAAALFASDVKPQVVKFFKTANKATQTYTLAAVNPTANASYTYRVRVAGETFDETEVTYTSDASPTDAEYAAGMVAALNAVAGKNYTAAGSASPITLTGTGWFSVEVLDLNTQQLTETTADPGVTADATAAFAEDADMYFFSPAYGSRAYVQPLAAWVEQNNRMMLAGASSSQCCTAAVGSDVDVADRIKTLGYKRTGVIYHRAPAAMVGHAWSGRVAPRDPGRVNFAHKPLAGVPQVPLRTSDVNTLVSKNANGYDRTNLGTFVTFWGTAGDGSYLDFTRAIDWVVFEVKRRVARVFLDNEIVYFTLEGFAQVESAIDGALIAGRGQGIVSPDVPYVIQMPDITSFDPADRLERVLSAIELQFTGSGALNGAVINLRIF